ncbi:putative drug exporter of the RND superfamily [Alicyclobacillus hesperidum]|uniref:Putative drug exporter of the RND superfamily n=1 Tax=Alicyclobacillus hesperidum TaxID=89784 RepID=A0A1H2UPI2_9BACL|nr:MMPL family transporter [Alicyclobacillus hesperidum]SDW57464.1 putative drug exporter of the RND superfamily [Alicyclobacillus hesperidum]
MVSQRYARLLQRYRYLVIAIWVAVVAAAHALLPQLNSVVAHRNTELLPNSTSVVVASNWLKQVNPKASVGSSAVVAIYNPKGLTDQDKSWFALELQQIAKHKTEYGVKSVSGAYNASASVQKQYFSGDGTVEIASIGFPGTDVAKSTNAALAHVKQAFSEKPADARILFTGDTPIENDNINISMNGASKTAGVTVALVLIILLVVFRSVVAPFLTLLSIGLSYLLTTNVVAALANVGLPVSTFTDTFLIAIIFGAGTDYSIIVMNRFREEASRGLAPVDALAAAIKGIGKTVVFSALTVFMSFATLYFARFGLFKSGVGVAVGIAITLAACLTFLPALMLCLGRFVFWPRKSITAASHKPSRIWSATGGLSLRHPWWTLAAVAVVLAPIAMTFTDQRTFDPTSDIPNAPSVVGFQIVSKAFGAGKVLPMDIVVHTPDDLRSPQGLATIENISSSVAKLPFVAEVDSATRPVGKVISQFQLAQQNQLAASGLGQVQEGLHHIASSVGSQSANQAAGAATKLASGARALATGENQLYSGLQQAGTASNQLAEGAQRLANGSGSLASGSKALDRAATKLATGGQQVASGIARSSSAAKQLASGTAKLQQGLSQQAQVSSELANALANWAKAHPSDAADPSWQQIEQLAEATAAGSQAASAASTKLAGGAGQLATGLAKLSEGAGSVEKGLQAIAAGGHHLADASELVTTGSGQLASGTARLATGLEKLSGASVQLHSGLSQWTAGAQQFAAGMQGAGQGENQLHNALVKLANGVGTVKNALHQTSHATQTGNPGFYVPASALRSNAGLQQSMNSYISPNGHTADIRVTLKTDPYSMTAIQQMPRLEAQAQAAFTASPIHTGELGYTGTTPTQAALNQLSGSDFTRMMGMILAAIFILLVLMLRSLLAPLYVIISLTGTYYVTMAILQYVAIHIMGKSGISWTVPFFALLLLIALGVDYSIFLMSRFDEEMQNHPELNIRSAMWRAMRQMGNVVFSAAAIMAGTFGSMSVSGVTTLVEIGLSVIIGLAMYALIVLAFFVPAATAIVGKAHFWPFIRTSREERTLHGQPDPIVD